jgi:hypothetical protein
MLRAHLLSVKRARCGFGCHEIQPPLPSILSNNMALGTEVHEARATILAVEQQIGAMGWDLFEIGLYNPNVDAGKPMMILRTWDKAAILRSVGWMRYENRAGRNIYIRPSGEHDLSLVDDLAFTAIRSMKESGFDPAVVIETSPENYQAWLKHSERLNKELSTAAARALADKFGGDRGAADWRHFGRLAGFTNRKSQYADSETGLYPFVRMVEAPGRPYPEAVRFLASVKATLERARAEREPCVRRASALRTDRRNLKSIDVFRNDARYCKDGNRIDLAYSIYALSHGASEAEVASAIRSRDLSHKGNEQRQDEYVARTIKKALASVERSL